MRTPPREPNPGEPISASYMRELVRYVRSLEPVAGHGVRVSRGANGTRIDCDAAAARVAAAEDRGCFAVKSVVATTSGTAGYKVTLRRCWFQCGGLTLGVDLMEINGFTGGILALEYDTTAGEPAAVLRGFDTIASMQAYQKGNLDRFVAPIYKFDGANVEVDFRIGVSASHYEFEDEGAET